MEGGDVLGGGLSLLGFLSVFHVVGGIALGVGARQWRSAWQARANRLVPPFLLLWGALFGGLPLIFGLATQQGGLLAGQGAILLASFAITFWFYEPLKEGLGHQYVFMIVFGLVFISVGALVSVLMLRSDGTDPWQAVAMGGIFFAVGSLVLSAGIVQWLKEVKSPEKEHPLPEPKPSKKPPEPEMDKPAE